MVEGPRESDVGAGAIASSSLPACSEAFLAFCRLEKGLAKNTLDAYRRDLSHFSDFCSKLQDSHLGVESVQR